MDVKDVNGVLKNVLYEMLKRPKISLDDRKKFQVLYKYLKRLKRLELDTNWPYSPKKDYSPISDDEHVATIIRYAKKDGWSDEDIIKDPRGASDLVADIMRGYK